MKAYVLAAGYATRLYPLTRDRPKPLLEVGGRPILGRILARLRALERLREVVVISNARFAAQLRDWADAEPGAPPIRVLDDGTRTEEARLGAIGDLAFALERVPVGDEDWLVVAGDNLLEFDLGPLDARFRRDRDPLIVVREVARAGPSPYNEVTLDPDDRVIAFREKPRDPSSPLAAIALYFFPAGVAGELTRYLALGGERDAPGHFLAWLVRERVVRAAPLPGPWFDIGTPETLADARARVQPTTFS